MALDPLKFKIAIERGDIQEELRKARKTLEEGLKDVPVHFKIANLEELKRQLGNIEVKINASSSSGANSLRNEKKTLDELKSSAEQAEKSLNRVMQRSVNVAKNESERLSNTLLTAQRTIERFGDKGFDTTRLERYKSMILEIRDNLDKINENKGKHPANGMTAGQYLNREDVSRVVSLMNTELGLYKSIGNEMERIVKLRNELSSVLSANPNSSYAGSLQAAIAGLDLRQGLMARLGPRDALESVNTSAYRSQMAEAISLISKVNTESRQSAQATKQAETENEKWAVSMNRAAIEATNLKLKIQALEQVKGRGVAAGVDVTSLEKKIAQMRNMLTILQSMEAGMKLHGFAGDYIKSAPYVNTLKMADAEASAVSKNAAEKEKAANSTRQLTAEEQRLSQALNQTTQAARGQSQVLSDLKSMAMQYLGVWGGQQFLHNIIEIGGQLEMQRLSIGAILQNQSQANTLFNQIKGLATQSPFGVVQLDQMTKQLTAYGFKYHELFDMTKRLADISAATGTSVDRLALALGHVRSEAALSGYTLRQFSMGNVPLLQKLSEKLGKTTKEIRDMVKKKEIGYDDVVGVLKDLTDEGGMFYNMQEVISQSVKAKFKNVKDAMDIMYGEMAEGGIGDALKAIATGLMEVTKNWKDAATIIGTGAALWSINRVALMLYTQTLGQSTAATLSSLAAYRQKEAALLSQAAHYRTLTAAEQGQLLTSTKLTLADKLRMVTNRQSAVFLRERIALTQRARITDLSMAITTGKLKTEELARAVALGKVNKSVALLAISEAKLDAIQKKQMFTTVSSVRTYGMFTGAINGAILAVGKLGSALKALVFNPQMMFMAGITAVMELWMRNNREMEKADELADSIYQHSQDAIRNTKTMMQNELAPMSIVGSNGSEINTRDFGFKNISDVKIKFPEIDKGQMQQVIDEWTTYVENFAVNAGQLLNEAFFDDYGKVLPLEKRFENLKKVIEEVALAQYGLQDIGNVFSGAVKATDGGWFDDDVLTDIGNYDKKLRNFATTVATTYRKYQKSIDDGIKAAERQSETFARSTEDLDTYAAKFKYLLEYAEKLPNAVEAFKGESDTNYVEFNRLVSSGGMFGTGQNDVKMARQEMMSELDSFYVQLEAELQTKGVDLNNLTTQQQQSLLIGYKKQLESIQGLSEETMRWLMELFAEHFGIELDLDDSKFIPKVDEANRMLEELIGRKWTVDINAASNVTNVIDEARKKYKQAKEYFEKASPILMKFGLSAKIGTKLTDAQIEAAVSKAPEMIREALKKALQGWNEMTDMFNNATDASKALGFNLEDEKKNKKKNKSEKKGSKEDPEAKAWKERIRLLKDARSWYDKWEKEIGHTAALEKVQGMFKTLVSKKDIESLEAYKKALEEVIRKAEARKAKNGGKDEHADEVIRQGKDAIEDINLMIFKRNSDDIMSSMSKDMDNLTRQWEIFNSVLEATGDRLLALKMAGLSGRSSSERNAADSLRNNIMGMPGGDLINFQKIISMTDKEIEKEVKNILGDSEKYSGHIGAIINGLKEWKKLSQDVMKQDIDDYAKLIGQSVDYEAQIKKVNKDFYIQKRMLDALFGAGKISQNQYNAGVNRISANKARGIIEALPEYKMLMDGVLSITKKTAEKVKKEMMDALYKQLISGTITAKEYADKIKEINERMEQLDQPRSKFSSFMEGGLNGLQQYFQKDAQDTMRQGAEQIQMGMFNMHQGANGGGMQQILDGFNQLSEGNKMTQIGEGMQGAANNFATTVMIIDKIIHGIDGIIQGLKQTYDQISDMLEALGSESAKDPRSGWGKVGTALSALSSGSQYATKGWDSLKNGDIGGVISGVVGSFTGPITAIAQAHDARRQAAIDELVFEVKKIGNTLNLIHTARERSLGYDNGNYRREMERMYSAGFGNANSPMIEFYSRGGLEGNGYKQELEALKKQREDYLRMYDEENSKKKESKEALEEYKMKIAELDDQIKNYAMDLANELWSIDLKGWADQIGDALMNAFENGTSAAEAFKDATADIMRSVVSEMLKIGFMQPMMEKLRDRLFGENGAFNYADPKSSMGAVLSELGKFFGQGGEGQQMIVASQEFLSGAEELLNKNYGMSLKESSQSSQTKGIQSQATEESIGILSGQMARIAQDVSVKRIFITQIATEQMPKLLESAQMQQTLLENQFQSVRAIEHAIVDGDGALYASIDRMSRKIDRAITPEGRMRVE